MFIPDPDLDFYPSRIPDPGVKMAPDPGSGSATLGMTTDGVMGFGILLSVRGLVESALG